MLNQMKVPFKEWVFSNELVSYRRIGIAAVQLLLVILAYGVSFLFRFEFSIPRDQYELLLRTMPLLIVARMAPYYYYKVYAGWWRFVSMEDLISICKAVLLGSILFLISLVFTGGLQGFPRSILPLEALLNLMVTGGIRFLIRFFRESGPKKGFRISKYVLIAGAGKAGAIVLNEIRTNALLKISAVGFVDDDPKKKGVSIHGVPVLGRTEDIPEFVEKHSIDEVLIVIPSASYKDIVRITEIAQGTRAKVKVLPGLGALIGEGSFLSQARCVSCDELLDRKIIKFRRESDLRLLREQIEGKAVLVTGAGGSIGSELCRQVGELNPEILVLYDRYENTLYELELEIKKKLPKLQFVSVVGDILNGEKLGRILRAYRINVIYHAAAYKHVPLMELDPIEAVDNNIMGTMNVARLAIEAKVDKFVMISTDKAVRPSSIMGTTKRVAELIVEGLGGNGTQFISVRFGNVIGSNGSVVPIFRKQIAEGGPVTLTHPEATRYFMSISEAVQLVMTAGAMGKGGEIFLLDMGDPVKIIDVAEKLIRFSGLEPEKDIDIVFKGLRPGEKLHEELFWKGEGIVPTENKKITMLKPNGGGDSQRLFGLISKLKECKRSKDVVNVLRVLIEIVPEARIGNCNFDLNEDASLSLSSLAFRRMARF